MKKVLFQESQKFTQWWIWGILLICLAFSIIPIYYAFNSGIGLSKDQWIGFTIITFILILFNLLELKTTIKEDGIYVKFLPFIWQYKFIPKEEIIHLEVKKYNPFMEYGGWGIRLGMNGWAYNIKGNIGMLVHYKNKKLMIGTQKPEELQRAIENLK